MYKVTFLAGEHIGRRLAVKKGDITIGRATDNNIVVETDDQVVWRHIRLERRENGIYLVALDADAPVWVNQSPAKETRLQSGDVIRLGQKTQLRFESHEEATLPMSHRRGGFFHKLAWIAASIALLAEVGYLLFIGIWNYDRKLFQTGPLKQVIEMAPPVERPKVIAPSAEEVRNAAAAREKLNELQSLAEMSTQTATQAPPITSTGAVSAAGVETGRVTLVAPPVETNAVSPVQPIVTNPPPPEPVAPAPPMPTPTQPIPPPAVSPPASGAQISIPTEIDLAPLAPITKAEADMAAPTRAVLASAHQVDRASLPRRIVISRCDLKTLPPQSGLEEMRELYVTLWAQDPAVRRIPGEEVTLVAHFFDVGEKTGDVRLSDARYPRRIMSVEGGIPSKPGVKVVFTSVVPDGFRRAEAESAGEKRGFLGYVVRVFYRGELQDVFAAPDALLTEPVGE